MITPALSLESILAAMTCLCSSTENGGHNFYKSLGNQVNMKYPNESLAIVKPSDISDMNARLHHIETTLAEFKKMQLTLLEAINNRGDNYNSFDECPTNVKRDQVKLRVYKSIKVVCEEVNGNQWIVIQNRKNGSVDFNQPWHLYKQGFGSLDGDFFIGLEKLHIFTNARPHELRVELEDTTNKKLYAHYDYFLIGNENESYALKAIGKFTGDAFDFFSGDIDRKFSTIDRDNDDVAEDCVQKFGAWWHSTCYSSLNGRYNTGTYLDRFGRGISWSKDKPAPEYYVKSVKIMIRPKAEQTN